MNEIQYDELEQRRADNRHKLEAMYRKQLEQALAGFANLDDWQKSFINGLHRRDSLANLTGKAAGKLLEAATQAASGKPAEKKQNKKTEAKR